ncbi:UNVERIFIED_CONTAM: hypothetical protein NCL1_06192 [Trichonephila clavipes]
MNIRNMLLPLNSFHEYGVLKVGFISDIICSSDIFAFPATILFSTCLSWSFKFDFLSVLCLVEDTLPRIIYQNSAEDAGCSSCRKTNSCLKILKEGDWSPTLFCSCAFDVCFFMAVPNIYGIQLSTK